MIRKRDSQISDELTKTIKDSHLQNVTVDLAESVVDIVLDERILNDIPILGTLIGLGKVGANIRDRIFTKKLLYFLNEISIVPNKDRKKAIDEIQNSDKRRIDVGQKLLYIIDKCNDHESAIYVAQFFVGFLQKKISYEDFLRGASIIQDIYINDLEYFLEVEKSKINRTEPSEEAPMEDEFPWINAGLCGYGYNDIKVRDQDDHRSFDRYIVEGGDVTIWITSIGDRIKEILSNKNAPDDNKR